MRTLVMKLEGRVNGSEPCSWVKRCFTKRLADFSTLAVDMVATGCGFAQSESGLKSIQKSTVLRSSQSILENKQTSVERSQVNQST